MDLGTNSDYFRIGYYLIGFYYRDEMCLMSKFQLNPLNAELNPIYHLLALLGAHHILHVSRIRVKDRQCYWGQVLLVL